MTRLRSLFFSTIIIFMMCGSLHASFNSYAGIQYSSAFNQTKIYEKYRNLMKQLGCADNVFQLDADSISVASNSLSGIGDKNIDEEKNNNVVDPKEFAAFQKECLDLLQNSRRFSLAGPMLSSLSDIAFTGLATAIIMKYMQDNLASGFTGTNFVYTALQGAMNSMKSSYNLIYWPENSLEVLENHFALNKCFIPRALWSKITAEFIAARQNEVSRQQHIHFIDFALGFTVYKPTQALQIKNSMSIDDVKAQLNQRIDKFFKDYKDQADINYIKINVAKFINLLVADRASKENVQTPRYLYLYGSGGIGKTHFVQTLSEWIDELMPQSVIFEDLVINSPDDLEGSPGYPGAFLKILRNQLIQNKRGSVVIIDEATWLNYGSMISPAKRIFNGDRSKLVTSYFGSNMDGTGVSLEIPPMLIFVAANEEIADPALKSRFDIVNYPMPMDNALVDYAYAIAEKSKFLQERQYHVDKKDISDWVTSLDEKDRNYRYVAGNVESFLLKN